MFKYNNNYWNIIKKMKIINKKYIKTFNLIYIMIRIIFLIKLNNKIIVIKKVIKKVI